MSDHAASTLVEMLVHFDIKSENIPDAYQLLTIDVPDDIGFAKVDLHELSADWPKNFDVTRAIGERWLAENTMPLLRVPSAIVPAAFNWLLNPNHADAGRIRIVETTRAPFDPRLLQRD
jgi:RES domain-containing protein